MNICITNHDRRPQFTCGIKRVSSTLAKEWDKDCNVYFITISPIDEQFKEMNGIPQFHLPEPNNVLSKKNFEFFTTFIREKKIDIILNQHSENIDFTKLCAQVAKMMNIKLVSTLHFSITHKNDTIKNAFFIKYKLGNSPIAWLKDFIIFIKFHLYTKHKNIKEDCRLYRNLIESSSKIILQSKTHIYALSQLLKLNHAELDKISAINNPIEINQEQGSINKKKRVLWCGRVEYGVKRVDRMLEIWKYIAPRRPDWELYIMGSGNIDYFKGIVKQQKIQNIVFTGSCNPYEYYKDGSILCMTSSTESWGMVLVEAQMFGCIPIAYNSYSSLSEIITDGINGYTIPAFEKEKFSERLMWLMDNEDKRNKMIVQCQKSVERFDVKIISRQWKKIFKELICHK